MKKVKFILISALLTINVSAQESASLLHQNLPELPFDMAFYDNEMYFSLIDEGKIVKIDLNQVNAPVIDVLTGLDFPTALEFVGPELYYIEAANNTFMPNTGILSKKNISLNTASETVATALNYPIEIIANADASRIYLGEFTFDMNGEIDHSVLSVLEISGSNATKTVLYDQFYNIEDIELRQNTLYIYAQPTGEGSPWNVYTLDVANITPGVPSNYLPSTFNGNAFGGTIVDNSLYVINTSPPFAISSLDVTDSSPALSVVVDDFNLNGNDVFIYETITNDTGDKIYAYGDVFDSATSTDIFVLFEANNTLSTDDFNFENTLKLRPNPSSDYIAIANLKQLHNYELYTYNGQLLKKGTIGATTNISVEYLSNGVYFLKVKNAGNFKFVKK